MKEKEILALNAFDPDSASSMDTALGTAVQRRLRSFGNASVLFYQEPIRMARAEGVYMFDVDGRRYLDLYNNVPSVGHSHPRVVEAVSRQVGLLNTHTRYLNDVVDTYAERLLATFPHEIDHLVPTCTGSEANDLALRIARTCTGGTGFIATETAYHGVTSALVDLSPSLGLPLAKDSPVRLVPPPRPAGDETGAVFARHVAAAFEDMKRAGIRPAGLIVDTIFSSDGVLADPSEFLKPVVEAVHAAGALFIADEVQPGFGRCGQMWGFARHSIVPDLVTMGKPMGNGFPVAALAVRSQLLGAVPEEVELFSTFGGNPVACAAALAVLAVVEEEGLVANAAKVGSYLRHGLLTLAERHPLIGDVRGEGLLLGVELIDEARGPAAGNARKVTEAMRERGILLSATGPAGNVLKIRPPLVFQHEHADLFLLALDEVLASS